LARFLRFSSAFVLLLVLSLVSAAPFGFNQADAASLKGVVSLAQTIFGFLGSAAAAPDQIKSLMGAAGLGPHDGSEAENEAEVQEIKQQLQELKTQLLALNEQDKQTAINKIDRIAEQETANLPPDLKMVTDEFTEKTIKDIVCPPGAPDVVCALPQSIIASSSTNTTPHVLELKAVQDEDNAEPRKVSGFRLDMTNVVAAQINSRLLVFVTDSSVRVLEAKVRTVSDQLIDLVPSTQANAFSLANLPVGVYTLDVITQKGNA
jgi:hypothetical protein